MILFAYGAKAMLRHYFAHYFDAARFSLILLRRAVERRAMLD